MEYNRKKSQLENYLFIFLLAILMVLISLLQINIKQLQGTARVVNYSGIVRGATQRLIKLEIAEKPNDNLIIYLDEIIDGLQNSSTKYDLIRLEDKQFQANLTQLIVMWTDLKNEIYDTREVGWENTEILSASEEYFGKADVTVTSSEIYSQTIASKLTIIEVIMFAVILAIVIYLIFKIVYSEKLMKRNKMLREKAYLDIDTKLPNKSKCTELLNDVSTLEVPTGFIYFDLNGLKKVNDTLGHVAGDTLILNFAAIIRRCIPPRHFVGRNGGDEFIAILYKTSEDEVKEILKTIEINVKKHNLHSQQSEVSYSAGYDISTNYLECTLSVLRDKADENMYLNKQTFYENDQRK